MVPVVPQAYCTVSLARYGQNLPVTTGMSHAQAPSRGRNGGFVILRRLHPRPFFTVGAPLSILRAAATAARRACEHGYGPKIERHCPAR
jgi:hypothetical protein